MLGLGDVAVKSFLATITREQAHENGHEKRLPTCNITKTRLKSSRLYMKLKNCISAKQIAVKQQGCLPP